MNLLLLYGEPVFVVGLPALVLAGFGIWMLSRETGDAVRAVGYLLTSVGTAISVGTVSIWLAYGMPLFL